MPAATSNDVANEALQLIGNNQAPVQGNAPTFDNSTAGKALQKLYAPAVATVQRQWGWDASRNIVQLTATGNTPPLGYAFEYAYPPNGIEVWQLVPAAFADVNNPLPVNWTVGNNLVASVQTKVIWTNLATAQATYNNNPNESTWDPLFREAVVRLLASELSIATEGKPDTAQLNLQSGSAFEALGEARPD